MNPAAIRAEAYRGRATPASGPYGRHAIAAHVELQYDIPASRAALLRSGSLRAAPGKFEVKRLGALEHSNDGMVVSSSGYSASNFTGSA